MKKPTEQTQTTDNGDPSPDATPPDATPESLTTENAELRAKLRAETARGSLALTLAAAGARTPGLLLDAAADAMQFTDEGDLANAEALLASLRTRFPEQFRTPRAGSIDGGAGRSTPPPLTREALKKMTPAEIAKLDWAVVRRVLNEK